MRRRKEEREGEDRGGREGEGRWKEQWREGGTALQ